jgi:nuclear transport factor 2 (NTF2) superfamily protein
MGSPLMKVMVRREWYEERAGRKLDRSCSEYKNYGGTQMKVKALAVLVTSLALGTVGFGGVATGVGKAAEATGRVTEKDTKETAHGTVKATKETAKAGNAIGRGTVKATDTTARATGKTAKKTGRGVWSIVDVECHRVAVVVRREKKPVTIRPPLPPFTQETAIQKVRMAEDGWNSRDPEKVALAYTLDSRWRNRAEFVSGRQEIVAFLTRKWAKELDYRLIKELWAFTGNRIAVRFAYEWHDDSGNWYRSYGNENWQFNDDGLMQLRLACINDLPLKESDRKYHWPLGRRPDDHPRLSDLGL